LIGVRRSQELLLRNRQLSAEEAVAAGLATRVVASERLGEEATAVAIELASGPTAAFGATRRLLLDSFGNSLETQMELESRSISALACSPDGKEGVDAFISKQEPEFGKDQ
jgi:2-(1,2-epoxy-1,2-dihydrophenyl)acetyl-CoA isomerase